MAHTAAVRHVAIIGAGVAGLQTARALQKQGISFTIYERTSDVGGVWRDNYDSYALQVPYTVYEFPEFPFPTSYQLKFLQYPDGKTVERYIKDYTTHFDLWPHIKLNTAVMAAEPVADNAGSKHSIATCNQVVPGCAGQHVGWRITYEQQLPGRRSRHDEVVDYLVVAAGQFSSPAIPSQYKDLHEFKGPILAGRDFTDAAALASSKRVLVIGGSKTAQDVSTASSKVATNTTLLFRRAHWTVPQWLFGFIPFHWLTYNRFGASFLPPYYANQNPIHKVLHVLSWPLKKFWWALTSVIVRVTLGLTGDQVPELPLLEDQYVGGLLNRRGFYNLLRKKAIVGVKGDIDRFTANGVVLTDGRTLGPFDLVVAATGYTDPYPFFSKGLKQQLGYEADGLWLFRHLLPLDVPNLAFVGSEHHTFQNIVTSGVQAEWLARVLAGHIELPAVDAQRQDVAATQAWKRSWMPFSVKRASALQLHQVYYHDQLLKDAGYNPHTRGWNMLAEYFVPNKGESYTAFFKDPVLRQQRNQAQRKGKPFITTPPAHKLSVSGFAAKGPTYGGVPYDELLRQGVVTGAAPSASTAIASKPPSTATALLAHGDISSAVKKEDLLGKGRASNLISVH